MMTALDTATRPVPPAYRRGARRRVFDGLVRALLRCGLGPRHTYLLTVRGRASGRVRSTPVTLVEDGGLRWLVAPYGEVAWVRNARAAGEVTLSRGWRSETVVAFELDAAEAAPVLKRYVREVPVTRPYFTVGPDAELGTFAGESARHPVFRLVTTAS
jgi:deazaflavin-dependent oxidoreductase (nitroreductase family)